MQTKTTKFKYSILPLAPLSQRNTLRTVGTYQENICGKLIQVVKIRCLVCPRPLGTLLARSQAQPPGRGATLYILDQNNNTQVYGLTWLLQTIQVNIMVKYKVLILNRLTMQSYFFMQLGNIGFFILKTVSNIDLNKGLFSSTKPIILVVLSKKTARTYKVIQYDL